MKLSFASLLVVSVLLSACVNSANLAPNPPVSIAPNETIVILGVVPSYQVSFKLGRSEGVRWNQNYYSISATSNFPENGYIVVKVPSLSSAETYGLAQIQPRGFGGQRFIPCPGNNVLTFDAPAGKVIYIGDVYYDMDLLTGKTLSYKYSSMPDKAKQFLAANHPDLATKMETFEINELPIETRECDAHMNSMYVNGAMIFIPGQTQKSSGLPRTYRAWGQ
jgi:hypothetical protein